MPCKFDKRRKNPDHKNTNRSNSKMNGSKIDMNINRYRFIKKIYAFFL